MGCFIQLKDPDITFNFVHNELKQKLLLAALIRYSEIDLNGIAEILDICSKRLLKVLMGAEYLDTREAEELGRLFLITFSD
ncbi:hypothetical protein FOG18_06390 [Legionella israelensis]|uniref:hypothetical protein n=1 Tax=Legionella israelensis TaxID=454 RepID=UPI00117D14F8|nr:hypothetical protein [Legionella israelensis]QDP72213.1 hypothetical protein FOG18_06390 [Legionella israelensis]